MMSKLCIEQSIYEAAGSDRGFRLAREGDTAIPVAYMTGDSAHEWASLEMPESVLIQKPAAAAQIASAISALCDKAGGQIAADGAVVQPPSRSIIGISGETS